MAKCQICEKSVSFGIKVSHSHRRSNRMWKPNLKRVRAILPSGEHKRIYACTRCIRSGLVTRGHGAGVNPNAAAAISELQEVAEVEEVVAAE